MLNRISWRARLATAAAVMVAAVACGGRSTATSPLPPSATASPSVAVDVSRDSLTVDGKARTYVLVTPRTLEPGERVPLVLVLHTTGGSAEEMRALLRFDAEAVVHRFVVAYPEAINSWNTCCVAGAGYPDDVAFVRQLVDRLVGQGQVDASRVFAVGASGGGMMVHRLACELSDRLVAVASIGGQLLVDSCRPARAISILELHGSIDSIVPIAAASSTMDRWAEFDGCDAIADTTSGSITITHVWSHCRDDAAVVMITFVERGHIWFGPNVPKPVAGPDLTTIIWNFFSEGTVAA